MLFNCVERGVQRSAEVIIGSALERVDPERFMIKLDTNTTSACKTAARESGSNGGVICPKCIAGQLGDGNVTRLIIGPIETSESATAVWSSVR